jgi:tRNA modification GTPase
MAADTIFALSSGQPPAAIAIIRISGPDARSALLALAGRVPAPRQASLTNLRNPADQSMLDQALILFFPGPDTATGEDLAELHLHGGRAVVRAVLSALRQLSGLRDAEAGEFTRRAFASGRIDLNAADGLADLLSAETEWQRRAATDMMAGSFDRMIEEWREDLLRLSALTEAELDFSDEDDVDPLHKYAISTGCKELGDSIKGLLAAPSAEKLRDGLRVVLGGPPNSGKSSLFNALIDRDAAIVSDIAGTTRDIIEGPMALEGIPLVLVDTAGVHDQSDDAIEKIGIGRARSAFGSADLILWLGAEGQGPSHPHVIEIAAMADRSDKSGKTGKAISVSIVSGDGITDLKHAIIDTAKSLLPPLDQFAVNARQRKWLAEVVDALAAAEIGFDWLIVCEELRRARAALDALTGRTHTEDLLDSLFGRFCIGK